MNSLDKNIEFKNVEFGYDDKKVFENLNLIINKGDFIGVAGQTGTGKTTLIKLLFRFYEINSDYYPKGCSKSEVSIMFNSHEIGFPNLNWMPVCLKNSSMYSLFFFLIFFVIN